MQNADMERIIQMSVRWQSYMKLGYATKPDKAIRTSSGELRQQLPAEQPARL